MKDRVLFGVTLVAFFMAIVVFNRSFPLALNIAIAFISALAVFEVIKALGLSDRWYITVPGMTAAVLVQFCEFQQAISLFIPCSRRAFSARCCATTARSLLKKWPLCTAWSF